MEYQTDTLTPSAVTTQTPADTPASNGHRPDSPADLDAMKERYWELTFRLYHRTEQPGDKEERSDLNRRIETLLTADNVGRVTSELVAWLMEKEIEDFMKVEDA